MSSKLDLGHQSTSGTHKGLAPQEGAGKIEGTLTVYKHQAQSSQTTADGGFTVPQPRLLPQTLTRCTFQQFSLMYLFWLDLKSA